MLKKLRAVLQNKKYNNENAQAAEESHSLVPEDGIMLAPQAAPEDQPAPFSEQSLSKLKVAAVVGAGVLTGAAIFCTGGVTASFFLPALGSFPATLGMYTAASAATAVASAGTGMVVAKKVEKAIENHSRKVGAHEESEHLSGAAAAYVDPQPVSEESLNEGAASATAASPFLQL